jgi:hypothetical protein
MLLQNKTNNIYEILAFKNETDINLSVIKVQIYDTINTTKRISEKLITMHKGWTIIKNDNKETLKIEEFRRKDDVCIEKDVISITESKTEISKKSKSSKNE